jgi:hypothetical protein
MTSNALRCTSLALLLALTINTVYASSGGGIPAWKKNNNRQDNNQPVNGPSIGNPADVDNRPQNPTDINPTSHVDGNQTAVPAPTPLGAPEGNPPQVRDANQQIPRPQGQAPKPPGASKQNPPQMRDANQQIPRPQGQAPKPPDARKKPPKLEDANKSNSDAAVSSSSASMPANNPLDDDPKIGLSWEIFVEGSNREKFLENKYKSGQKIYGEACLKAVKIAIQDLKNNMDPKEILEKLAAARHNAASGNGKDEFGKLRDPSKMGPKKMENPITPVTDEDYPRYLQRFIDRNKELNPEKKDHEFGTLTEEKINAESESSVLTQFCPKPFSLFSDNPAIVHANVKLVAPILDKVVNIAKNLNDSTKTNEERIKLIAEIHWWLANAMPWERGSAAISHMFAIALMSNYGIAVNQRSKGVIIDLEAFLKNKNEFINNYLSFYQNSEK